MRYLLDTDIVSAWARKSSSETAPRGVATIATARGEFN